MLLRFAPLLFAVSAFAQQDAARMDQIVQSYFANKQFMGTALVARGGQVLFSKAYGQADLEWDVPNTPDTKFRLGSLTKQFTAASILLLEERGKLSTGDPVRKHMPDAPAAWDKITIRHLLTHTSGIPNFTSFPEYSKLEPFATTPAEVVARFTGKPLDFPPGEKFSYSNSGYLLLGYLLEKISGQPYEQFVRENIFTPLAMKDSGYDSNTAIIPRRAQGYTPGKDGPQHAGFIHMSIPHAAGALYSTTGDLLKWNLGLYGGKILQPASLEKMTKPFLDNYAFGLTVETSDGRKVIRHGGGIEGFNTHLEYYPDDQLTVVVLANLNGQAPADIARKLAAVAHGEAIKLQTERKEITLDAAVLDRYTGVYQLPAGPNLLVTRDGAQLSVKLGTQAPLPAFAESGTVFFLKAVDAQIEFSQSAAGSRAPQVTLHQNGRDQVAKRLDDTQAKLVLDAAAAVAKRFKDQAADPRSEAALRKMIEDFRAGKPDYESMSAGLASATRQQLPNLQSRILELGAVRSIKFTGVGPAGPDIYQVQLEKGGLEYRIWMSPDGKIESANVRPM